LSTQRHNNHSGALLPDTHPTTITVQIGGTACAWSMQTNYAS